jgi:glycosyltransferase involved in cell wall biosynthesis
MSSNMHISYITIFDALNIYNWSGLGLYIGKSLENEGADIDYIGNLQTRTNPVYRIKGLLYNRLLRKRYLPEREHGIARRYAAQATARLKSNTDIIFSPGSMPIAFMENKRPKVIYSDATFMSLVNYYDFYFNVCAESLKKGNALEQQAYDSSSLLIYSSEWAATSAIKHYNIPPSKVKVVPFGANIECNRTVSNIKEIIDQRPKNKCILLFLGVDWIRKGGDMALQVATKLNEIGLNTELHIAGVHPNKELPPFVKLHGYISKSTEEGRKRLNDLMANSHFLILPSKADCTPVVFSEANSFALPVISTKTGGIPTIIRDNVNGITYDMETPAIEYVEYIELKFRNYQQYIDLALSSFNEYQQRLNWKVTGKEIMKLLKML